jgi:hypothetical protein
MPPIILALQDTARSRSSIAAGGLGMHEER